ncbi:MAG: hypothetical protein M1831_004098 [Alyxoria varia]|nr:MAG: hypothetical protein M1831_004098 [Alyxoria varia]
MSLTGLAPTQSPMTTNILHHIRYGYEHLGRVFSHMGGPFGSTALEYRTPTNANIVERIVIEPEEATKVGRRKRRRSDSDEEGDILRESLAKRRRSGLIEREPNNGQHERQNPGNKRRCTEIFEGNAMPEEFPVKRLRSQSSQRNSAAFDESLTKQSVSGSISILASAVEKRYGGNERTISRSALAEEEQQYPTDGPKFCDHCRWNFPMYSPKGSSTGELFRDDCDHLIEIRFGNKNLHAIPLTERLLNAIKSSSDCDTRWFTLRGRMKHEDKYLAQTAEQIRERRRAIHERQSAISERVKTFPHDSLFKELSALTKQESEFLSAYKKVEEVAQEMNKESKELQGELERCNFNLIDALDPFMINSNIFKSFQEPEYAGPPAYLVEYMSNLVEDRTQEIMKSWKLEKCRQKLHAKGEISKYASTEYPGEPTADTEQEMFHRAEIALQEVQDVQKRLLETRKWVSDIRVPRKWLCKEEQEVFDDLNTQLERLELELDEKVAHARRCGLYLMANGEPAYEEEDDGESAEYSDDHSSASRVRKWVNNTDNSSISKLCNPYRSEVIRSDEAFPLPCWSDDEIPPRESMPLHTLDVNLYREKDETTWKEHRQKLKGLQGRARERLGIEISRRNSL